MLVTILNAVKFEGTHYAAGAVTVADDLGQRMINNGVAKPSPNNKLQSTRDSLASDSGNTLYNDSSSNFTIKIVPNTILAATLFQQENNGTITLLADSANGVSFTGTNLTTTGVGSLLTILPTSTPNTYHVVKGGL